MHSVVLFLQNYLTNYNYISQSRSGNQDLTTAIKKFQTFFGLPVTGELDDATVEEMKKPRCGVPDIGNNDESFRVKRYSTWTKWSKTNLKYYLSYGEDMLARDQSRIIAKAFKTWSDVASKLRFSRTYSVRDADFKIRFGILF